MSVKRHDTSRGTTWEARFRGPDGRERARRFRTKREAVAWEASQRTAVARGTWIDPNGANWLFADVADEWLKSNPAKRATSTCRDVSALRKHILPVFGHRRIGSVTKPEVQQFVNTLATTTLQSRSVHRIYGTLRAVFKYAVASDWLGRTPCRDINLPARRRTSRPTVTPDDVIALADAMRPEYAPMVWVGIVTGLRWGEVAGLRVGHLDLLRRTITVEEQVARGPGGITIIDAPKSEAGNRVVTIPTQLADLLAGHVASRGLTAADDQALLSPARTTARRSTTRTGGSASGSRPPKPPNSLASAFTTCAGPTPRRWCATSSM